MDEIFFTDYDNLLDEDLAELSAGGDKRATECILTRYKNLVRSKARMYFLVGADKEDIIQEGMIGLFKAIRDFDRSKLASFKGFAELCVRRQIITAVKTATRQKHMPLNSYVSLNNPLYDDEPEGIQGELAVALSEFDPEHLFIRKEKAEFLGGKIEETLSELEKKVLGMYLEGMSYQEIAQKMSRSAKSIDNALQRVKKKMEKFSDF